MDLTPQRHYTIRETDAVDTRHPVEEIEPQPERQDEAARLGAALGRLLRWIIEPGALPLVGARAMTLVWLLRPDLLVDKSLAGIARQAGVTRACINAWSVQIRDLYGVRSPYGRSDDHRREAADRGRRKLNNPPPQ